MTYRVIASSQPPMRSPLIEIIMRENRSSVPKAARWCVVAWLVLLMLISTLFVLRGAWPVAIYAFGTSGLLYCAFRSIVSRPPSEETLTVTMCDVIHVLRHPRRTIRTTFPRWTTRLSNSGDADAGPSLVLRCRQRSVPLGLCLSASERREVALLLGPILSR
jgi:uncharacterized membrane protein